MIYIVGFLVYIDVIKKIKEEVSVRLLKVLCSLLRSECVVKCHLAWYPAGALLLDSVFEGRGE